MDTDNIATKIVFLRIREALYSVDAVVVLLGIPANALCVRTFLKMGLKDSITISFFHMAVSDLFLVVLSIFELDLLRILLHTVGVGEYLNTLRIIPENFLMVVMYFLLPMFLNVSAFFIAFLAVQRSLCVLRPLQFKHVFTRRLTFIVALCIWGYWVICTAIAFAEFGFVEQRIWYGYNSTRMILVLASVRRFTGFMKCMRQHRYLMQNVILQAASVIIVLTSLIILAHALIKSVRFRQRTSHKGVATMPAQRRAVAGGGLARTAAKKDEVSTIKLGASARSSKEMQAIIQVAILSLVFLLTKIPSVIEYFILSVGSFYMSEHSQLFLKQLYSTFSIVNASFNFLVYLKFNTKFRETCFKRNV